jgi:RNase H-like domain found in reverse transcriptase
MGTSNSQDCHETILIGVDKFRNPLTISFASKQLKDHEKNYSSLVQVTAAVVWGIDVFNESLHQKRIILFIDHKPLDKMDICTLVFNRLQSPLLDNDFGKLQ